MPLGAQIKQLRTEVGLTLDALANQLATSRQVVIGWEKGVVIPQRRSEQKIRERLGGPPATEFERARLERRATPAVESLRRQVDELSERLALLERQVDRGGGPPRRSNPGSR